MSFNQTGLPKPGEQVAKIVTKYGEILVRFFPEFAPKTVENFLGLAGKGYYDGIIFHRVIPDFMIQTGDPTGTGRGGESLWGGKFADEFDYQLKNIRGALSMANAGPGTNGSQFFIVQAPATPWLDGKHSVFGQVYEGMEVVDAITALPRDSMDKPLEEVRMEKVEVLVI
jgi:peptidyl-prolyl cis-trans isomerase B (cyclophilin B)